MTPRGLAPVWHRAHLRRTALLGAGALEGTAREQAEHHARNCRICRAELVEWHALGELLAAEPLRLAPPPLEAAELTERVLERLDRQRARERTIVGPGPAWPARGNPVRPWWVAAAAAGALVAVLYQPARHEPRPAHSAPPLGVALVGAPRTGAEVGLPDESLGRLERRLAREHAARYLAQAEDVLVHVASLPGCTRRGQRLDVGAEARRSRDLLARRALMLEVDTGHVDAAQAVLQDVEQALRQVAAFDDCETAAQIRALGRRIDERRLLLRIAVVERELAG